MVTFSTFFNCLTLNKSNAIKAIVETTVTTSKPPSISSMKFSKFIPYNADTYNATPIDNNPVENFNPNSIN